MIHYDSGRLWILGMKTKKFGTIIETVNGGWSEELPAFLIENSTVTLSGVNERNYNRQPVTLWVRQTQGTETRETPKMPWVYLSQPQ